jgi:predicted TPR repeat methyltransferase
MPEPFDTARRHFMDGVAHHQAGRFAQAEAALLASLALVPGRPSSLMNLGAAQLAQGRAEEALASLDQAIAADAANAQAYCHRAAAHAQLDQTERALADYTQALALAPELEAARWHQALLLAQGRQAAQALALLTPLLKQDAAHAAPAWLLAGQCQQALERTGEALNSYRQALRLDGRLARAHALLGQALQQQGQADDAAEVHRQAIDAGVDAELNRYLLAGLQREGMHDGDTPARSPDEFVRGLFDPYAADFDQHLVNTLHYRGHVLVAEVAQRALEQSGRQRFAHALDLGCGTGLCGRLLAPLAERIDGVDLSPTMVQAAQRTGAYASVVQAELGAFVAGPHPAYDLVVAADVFIYIGALESLLADLRRSLAPGAWLVFTVETPAEADDGVGPPDAASAWRLQQSLRYAHPRGYIDGLASRLGFTVALWQSAELRHEQARPILGAVVGLVTPRG